MTGDWIAVAQALFFGIVVGALLPRLTQDNWHWWLLIAIVLNACNAVLTRLS